MGYSRDQSYAKPHESGVAWRSKSNSLLHGRRAMVILAINRLKAFWEFALFSVAFLPVEAEVSIWSVI